MEDLISRKSAIEAINGMIDRFERILADIRESKGDDSVCGMCEYDGAYMGQSGDWCNECPGFDKDDCFKLSDKCRKRWIGDIVLLSAAPSTAHTTETTAETTAPSTDGWAPCIARLPKPYRGGDEVMARDVVGIINNSVDNALTLLDSIYSSGRMMYYSDYCALHDAIAGALAGGDE